MRSSLIRPMDTRALFPLLPLSGVLIWKMSLQALLIMGLVLFFLFLRSARPQDTSRFFRTGIPLIIYWTAFSALSMELTGSSHEETLQASLMLTARLLVILLLGSWTLRRTRPQDLSRAVVWFLKGLMGKRAWEVGLALTIMIRSLPSILHRITRSREAAVFRLRQVSALRRMAVVTAHCMRELPSASEGVALAITVRRLDSPCPWTDTSEVPFGDWIKASIVGIALTMLTFVP